MGARLGVAVSDGVVDPDRVHGLHELIDSFEWLPTDRGGFCCRRRGLILAAAAIDQSDDAPRQVLVDAGEPVDLDTEAGLLVNFAS